MCDQNLCTAVGFEHQIFFFFIFNVWWTQIEHNMCNAAGFCKFLHYNFRYRFEDLHLQIVFLISAYFDFVDFSPFSPLPAITYCSKHELLKLVPGYKSKLVYYSVNLSPPIRSLQLIDWFMHRHSSDAPLQLHSTLCNSNVVSVSDLVLRYRFLHIFIFLWVKNKWCLFWNSQVS